MHHVKAAEQVPLHAVRQGPGGTLSWPAARSRAALAGSSCRAGRMESLLLLLPAYHAAGAVHRIALYIYRQHAHWQLCTRAAPG